jgi:hypothetical protein
MSASTALFVPSDSIQLLNASYEVLDDNITPQHAASLLARGKVTIEEGDPTRKFGAWIYPKVVKLIKYVWIKVASESPRFSKRGVLSRDNRICAYCGGTATTIDHVHPKSKGGKNDWLNVVAACQPCNHRKGNKLLRETDLKLGWKPYVPKRTAL